MSNEMDLSSFTMAPKAVEAVEGRLAALLSVNMVEKVVLVTIPRANNAKGRAVKTKLLTSLKEYVPPFFFFLLRIKSLMFFFSL